MGHVANPKKNIQISCKWCGQFVVVRTSRQRPVCMEWACQNKDYMEVLQNRRINRKKTQRRAP